MTHIVSMDKGAPKQTPKCFNGYYGGSQGHPSFFGSPHVTGLGALYHTERRKIA